MNIDGYDFTDAQVEQAVYAALNHDTFTLANFRLRLDAIRKRGKAVGVLLTPEEAAAVRRELGD